ncbi:MAG: hypothetical protein HXL37_02010 [Riemerella sp.]|nr:hypothetical protein [Riemerella sp.]
MKEIDDLEKGFVPNQEHRDAEKTKQMEIEFDEKGFEYAHNTNANISIFKNGLDSVYQFFLKEQKLDKEAIKTRIKTLNDRKEDFEKSSIEKSAEIEKAVIQNEKHQEDVEKYNNEVVGLKNEILEIKKKEPKKGNETMLNVYLTGAFFLLIGTLVMYMATFGSALLGLEEGDTFIRGSVFSDLGDLGAGNLVLAIVVSLIPIGCGFAYTFLRRKSKIAQAFSFLIVVLLVDGVIGYLLSETIYNQQYNEGIKEEPWKWNMFITDFHFWAVLVINFAMYYGFSWFADQFLTEKINLEPDSIIQKEIEQVQNKMDVLNKKIEELEQNISENKQRIKTLEGDIEQNKITIEKIKNSIISYERGNIPIDTSYLKSLISKYMEGYARYVSGKYKHDEKNEKEIKNSMEEERDKWYKGKEEEWV